MGGAYRQFRRKRLGSVIPAKAGIHFALRRSRTSPSSFPRRRESILLVRCTLAERSSLLGFARRPWRASHFLCLHKESNQRNAPSVTRRPRSGRFAAVGRGLAAGLLPCRQMRAVLARTAYGVRGLVRPTFAASQRGQSQRAKQRRWVPAFAGMTKVVCSSALCLLRQGLPRSCSSRVPSRSRRAGGGKVAKRSPAGCRRVCGQYRDVLSANPGACSRSRRAWMPVDRDLEGALSWVTFFGQAKKVTRPPRMAGETTQGRGAVFATTPKDKSKNGFRPSPE